MQKTIFRISKMDCPSEEQIIRMKLDGLSNINSLDFNIPNRQLTVLHTEDYEQILQILENLKFNASIVNSIEVHNYTKSPINEFRERKLLLLVLAINFSFFILEVFTGFVSNSMGLVADSFDMLADTIVYGLALFAVGGSMMRKRYITKSAGYFQLTLTVLGFVEVIRRFIGLADIPEFKTIIIVSIFALIANIICFYLLQKSKSTEAHMQASMIFTSNDIIVNFGVIIAGGLVYITDSKYPDLIIGIFIFFIVGQGAIKILKLSK